MTVPEDLTARFSLRTKAKIEEIAPEFPGRTKVRTLPSPAPDTRVYEASFEKPGENMLTIVHDGGRKTQLPEIPSQVARVAERGHVIEAS